VLNYFPSFADMDGDQPVVFYYIDPGYALERHAGKSKFKGKFYYQYEREDSWTRPGVRAFGRVNGGLAFQGFQKIADALSRKCSRQCIGWSCTPMELPGTLCILLQDCLVINRY
jgi:hypothetical protein